MNTNRTLTSLDELPLLLTVREAGELLRIGRSAAYAAVRSGDIPTIRVGRQLRVPRERFAELLAGGIPTDALRRAA